MPSDCHIFETGASSLRLARYNPAVEFRARVDRHWRVVQDICRRLAEAGGRAHLVGGCVRDALLGRELQDFDIEVFDLPAGRVREVVSELAPVDLVGESFGVLKLRHLPIDVSLPRRESKSGRGHRGFEIFSDPHLSVAEAAARRDFTINSMAWDPIAGELHDPWGGAADLERGILRHTSERFADDPLRVLRGMQLAARFELEPAAETVRLCRTMESEGLAGERIFEEWRKLVLRGRRISSGLDFLLHTTWLRYFPELEALVGCPQDPEWHPEGDVFTHTGHVMDAFARRRLREDHDDLVVGLACLCHDFGKPATTELEDGRWRSKGHEAQGEAPTRSFLARLTKHERLVEEVVPLVVHHLKPDQLYRDGSGDAAVRRLARKVGRIDRLLRVARADRLGRPPLPDDAFPAAAWLEERARALEVSARSPRPLVMGRHLIDRGREPGPHFGPLLEACFEAQLEGEFQDLEGGLAFLDRLLAERAVAGTPAAGGAKQNGDRFPS